MEIRIIIDLFSWSSSTREEKIVYDGDYGDVPEHMNYAEVSSIDNVYADNKGVICLNVWEVFYYANFERYKKGDNFVRME